MCDSGDRAEAGPVEALPADLEWKGEVLPLEPVDELSVLMVSDNVTDILLPDQGPARRLTCRWPSTGSPRWSRSARAAGCAGCCSTPA
jgi:hypothetical protein